MPGATRSGVAPMGMAFGVNGRPRWGAGEAATRGMAGVARGVAEPGGAGDLPPRPRYGLGVRLGYWLLGRPADGAPPEPLSAIDLSERPWYVSCVSILNSPVVWSRAANRS